MPIQFNSSLSSTGPFTAPSFTGSLFGTASHVKVTGSGVTVNWDGDLLQLTASASPVQNASQVFVSQSSPGVQPSGSLWWSTDDGNLYVQTEGPSGSSFVAATNTIVGAAGNAVTASYATTASYLIGYEPVVLSAGPGISIDGYKISASVLTVNGSSPDTNGNISTALTEVITGVSSSLVVSSSGDVTSSLTEGTVWIISGETTPNEALNGVSYIYDVQDNVGEWLKLSSLDQVTADSRYLMLTPQSPLAGPLETTWGVTGSLLGTATFATTADTASYFITSSVTSASFSQNALSASYFITSSVTSASFAQTASVAGGALSASYAVSALTASHAITASYVKLEGGGAVLVNFTGSWTITPGANTYTFTVDAGSTYTMWLYGNVPNGIIAWNCTATISNTNVPVVGVQYAWVYTGGGSPLDITSIPAQFVGTSGSIMRTSGIGVPLPTNTFRFGISNTTGVNQTVYYGYTKQ